MTPPSSDGLTCSANTGGCGSSSSDPLTGRVGAAICGSHSGCTRGSSCAVFHAPAVRLRFIECACVGVEPVVSAHSSRLMGAEIGLPIGVAHPAQQDCLVEHKLLLIITEVKAIEHHHWVVRQRHCHAAFVIREIHPSLHREVISTDAGQLILARSDRLPTQVQARGCAWQIEGKEQVGRFGMNAHSLLPPRFTIDEICIIRQEDALVKHAVAAGRLKFLDHRHAQHRAIDLVREHPIRLAALGIPAGLPADGDLCAGHSPVLLVEQAARPIVGLIGHLFVNIAVQRDAASLIYPLAV
jgi:hypothetical protein